MTAVRFRDAVAYGARLYGYLLLVTVVGGAMLALGGVLLWTEFQAWAASGAADVTAAASGGLLAFLGTSILSIGYAGVAYKLLVDAVAVGGGRAGADGSPAVEPSRADQSAADGESDRRRTPSVDPDASGATGPDVDSTADDSVAPSQSGPGPARDVPAVGGADAADADVDESAVVDADAREPAGPPEPTPEEIAFGTSDGEESAATDGEPTDSTGSVDEDGAERDTSSGSVQSAGRNASSDPVADPVDDE